MIQNSQGVILTNYSQKETTVVSTYYANLKTNNEKRHDNSDSYTSAVPKVGLVKAASHLVELPPYTPDLSPSDYRLFSKLEEHCLEKDFLQTVMRFVLWFNSLLRLNNFFSSKGFFGIGEVSMGGTNIINFLTNLLYLFHMHMYIIF